MEEEKPQSFWDYGLGNFLRRLFVLAIVWIPAYFAMQKWGGKGFIGVLAAEFILLIVVPRVISLIKNK